MHSLFVLVSLLSLFCALSSAIKVMSYNVWNFDDGDSPPWEQRKVGIAQMVNEFAPDIVAFQELRAGCGLSQYVDLVALLPQYQHTYYQPVMTYLQYVCSPTTEGQAIFSRVPLQDASFVLLPMSPKSGDTNQRAVFHAQIEYDSAFIDVFATHLSTDSVEQMKNAAFILNYTQSFTNDFKILFGDFNSYHANNLISFLTKTGDYPFQDAWIEAGNHSLSNCTYHCTSTPKYGATPQVRDHILSTDSGALEWGPVTCALVGDMTISDHRAITAVITEPTPLVYYEPEASSGPSFGILAIPVLLGVVVISFIVYRRWRRAPRRGHHFETIPMSTMDGDQDGESFS